MNTQRATFGNRLGVVLATVGSAVGLGNIWRFPYMLGTNGGAAFLFVYILCILLLGLPVMISEFFIGRYTKRNAVGAFRALAPQSAWVLIGYNGVIAAFMILGFYYVIAGWTLEYIVMSLTTPLANKSAAAFESDFTNFSTSVFLPIFYAFVFMGITQFIVTSGIKNGIERASKILMPLFFLLLVVLCIRSLTLSGAAEGLRFLFWPDIRKINSAVILSGLGQAFFSLSVGMGCLITYSSYFKNNTNLQRTALEVVTIDTLVAVLAGVMIFPAVFHFHIPPTSGVNLAFITLPNIFGQLPFGNVWSFIFFMLLAIAALTSTLSLHEVVTAYLHEERGFTRKRAAFLVSLGAGLLCIFSSLSFGLLRGFTLGGLTFFELLDYVTAKLLMPLGGMFICIFIGRRIEQKILKAELTNQGSIAFYFFHTYAFFIKYIVPVIIAIIFLYELGLLKHLQALVW